MIFLLILEIIFPSQELDIIDWIFIISVLFCFVTSIIHLVKYKEKALAITSLVISSIGTLLFLIGFLIVIAEILIKA